MDRYGITGADAFRRIQKRSMDTRRLMHEVVEAILLASEMDRSEE